MKRKAILLISIGIFFIISSCLNKGNGNIILNNSEEKSCMLQQSSNVNDIKITENSGSNYSTIVIKNESNSSTLLIKDIKNKYQNSVPKQWGEKMKGVVTGIETKDKIIALTFDACGGTNGSGYDSKLIEYLIKEKIPATLFLNARWIDANLDTFAMLSKNSLFEIENHGYLHKPLSVNGRSIYNIKGTNNLDEVINEVYLNEQKIQQLTGRKPKYFRSGTAYYDDVSVGIARELGMKPVGFSVIGDAGATFSAEQIKKASLTVREGSIVIYHMNHPKKDTAKGIIKTIPLLRAKGFKFVKLEDYDKYLR
jgi:peptidoglycan/xylan/chitin deacetylase (PgdA/CDA1 family)